ncbi:MAG: hypothetical protein JWP18_597 [Solirubrobacterales bacterium]|nr:hypothetical protein [Solirubrobacterales bacterium]
MSSFMDDVPAPVQRAARNEAAFRRLNENLADVLPADARHPAGYVCECASADCRRIVDLTMDEYQAVRADKMRFLVVPGHERGDVENVVETHEHYLVVRKHEDVAAIVNP